MLRNVYVLWTIFDDVARTSRCAFLTHFCPFDRSVGPQCLREQGDRVVILSNQGHSSVSHGRGKDIF